MDVPNLLVSLTAPPKSGKTHLALTFPEPIKVYAFDTGVDYVRETSFADKDIDIFHVELPFADDYFDVVLLHEVLEHVDDDQQAVREACRVTKPGGRVVVFVPNRLYPFETHGACWKGKYHFGNIPLINYLPNRMRNQLCPHVRSYTRTALRRLFHSCPHLVIVHTQIYPGYDNIAYQHPAIAKLLRGAYAKQKISF